MKLDQLQKSYELRENEKGEVDGVMFFAIFVGVEMQLEKVREMLWKGKQDEGCDRIWRVF